MKKIMLFWLIIGSFLFAQKLTQMKFEGLAYLSKATAKEISGMRIGEEMDAEKINDSIKNFFSQGYFEDVWVDKKGGTLVYHFKEKRSIANVEIKGYGSGDDGKELLKGIGLKKGDMYDERRVKKAKSTIRHKLEVQGFYDTVIEVSTKNIGDSSISVVFEVNKGEKIIIKKMNFVGAEGLIKSDIELDLANKEKDWLGWMPWRNNGEANVEQLKYDSYRVRDAYMSKGYLDAKVSEPLMRVDFGSYKAEVDYKVVEGVQYHVGTLAIKHKVSGLSTQRLKNLLTLKEGKVFDVKRMRKDIKILEEEVGNYGYAYVKVYPQMQKNTAGKVVNLTYTIQEGQIVTIGDVIISGNDTTKDRVIRRYIYLAPGDKFKAKDLKDSKSALGRTGFFSKVEIEQQRVSANKINLLVKVKETSTGTISAGGGYGSYEGIMLNASISDKNIFGSGINTTLGFELSKISKNYNLSFVNPKIWDSMYSLAMSFYKRDYKYIDYTQNQTGASVNVGREFYRNFHASLGLGYVDNQSTYNSTSSSLLVNYYNDKYKKSSLFFSLNYDDTDDFYVPREGIKASVTFEYAKLSGKDANLTLYPKGYGNIIRTSGQFGIYYGMEDIIDYDLILRAKLRYNNISSASNEYLPIAERLFMGGAGSLRGYDPYTLSPAINGERVGGTSSTTMSLEASIPLSKAAKMRLAFFYDYGILSSGSLPTSATTSQPLADVKRSSAGVVLEWQSAFGPIDLIFAKALNPQLGDRTSVFEFSMGTKF